MNIEQEMQSFCKHFGWEMESEQIHEIRKYGEAVREEERERTRGEIEKITMHTFDPAAVVDFIQKSKVLKALTPKE